MQEAEKYVRNRDGNWYVGSSRVAVYSVIAAWNQGYSPEEVQSSFPVLSLVEEYGTILYYLGRREELDAFFRETDSRYHRLKAEAAAANPEFYQTMRERIARYRATQAQHDVAAS